MLFSGASRPSPEGVARVQRWARDVFGGDGSAVLVTELRCREPGCPPVETVIAVLRSNGERRLWKVPRAIDAVREAEVRALEGQPPERQDGGHAAHGTVHG